MKSNKYILLLTSVLFFASCDLTKIPEGSIVTEEQNNEIVADRPELLRVKLNAMKSGINVYGTISTSSTTYHNDYGVPAFSMKMDLSSEDMVSGNVGYNWFSSDLTFTNRIPTSSYNKFIWMLFYNHIKTANECILAVTSAFPEESERTGEVINYLGQAYASRAYDYTQLIQVYQLTYKGHENELGLPLVLETTTGDDAQNNPRVTVQATYDQILSDLNNAVEFLSENPISRTDKAQITAEVAYGLRARVHMLMNNWDLAIADAEKAMVGATPYSLAEVSVPAFNDAAAASWIWGSIITDQNDVVQTGIINWPSHLCSLTGNGYTTGVGVSDVYKCISSKLWNTIPDTDVRKGWWVDADLQSPVLNAAYGSNGPILGPYLNYAQYANVKFGPEGNEMLASTNAQDWPLMRVEEMILIKAEALAQQGKGGEAATALATLMQYRDPAWNMASVDVDYVWNQRRVELWGEGFALLDVLRLKKPIDRTNANYSSDIVYQIAAEDNILIYQIPEVETESNKGISASEINPVGTPPVPVS